MAGGKSSRMGTDKSFVKLKGKPVIEHVLERVSSLGQAETLLITNRPGEYMYLKLPMYSDIVPDKGSLGGIYTAIHHSRYNHALIVACDMPFVNKALLQHMLSLREDYDVIVPVVDGHPQGLHAIYSKNCLGPIRRRLDADRLKVIGFYDDVRVRYLQPTEHQLIDPQGLSFFNVNTPNELEQARQHLKGKT